MLEEIFEEALEIGLEKRDQQRKLERRRRRQAKTTTLAQTSGLPCPGKVSENDETSANDGCGSPAARSRYIPSAVRERVLEHAGHRCEYRGPGGTRCTARAGLEIEHERPFAIFSSHDERSSDQGQHERWATHLLLRVHPSPRPLETAAANRRTASGLVRHFTRDRSRIR